jgi:TolB-like protein/Tfp pilus assembly protein PilF
MNEPEVSKEPDATPDRVASSPAPPPDTEPFVATFHRMWGRLKAHKVVQWTLAYLAIAYTLLHGAEMLAGSLSWSHGFLRVFTLVLILGVPVIVTLAWYHGARGLQRVSGTEIMIIAILLALGGAFLWRDSTNHQDGADTAVAMPASAATLPVVPVPPHDKSIAVLPFADMSAEKDQEYMSDGLADELLNLLAQVPDLKVIARTSSFVFKGKEANIAEIAKTLNVAHVLEGSVRTSGDKLRITAQLIRTSDSTHLWSERYDRPLDDIFAVQDEIARAIAQVLQIKLMGGTVSRREGGTQNLEAYQLYLRAVSANLQNSRSSLDAAAKYLEQAIKLDPNYGRAWSYLSQIFSNQADNGFVTATDGYERSRKAAQSALQLNSEIGDAHARLQYIHVNYDWDWAAAELEGRRALALAPTDPDVLNIAGVLSYALGRWDDAERHVRSSVALDPLNTYAMWNLGFIYYGAGRFAESEDLYRKLLEIEPGFGWARNYLGLTLLAQGEANEALTVVQHHIDNRERLKLLPIFLQAAGHRAEADEALQAQIAQWANTGAFYVAMTYAHRGDHEHAIAWLERAYRQKDAWLATTIVGEHVFRTIATDPRYKAFLRKMNLPVETGVSER